MPFCSHPGLLGRLAEYLPRLRPSARDLPDGFHRAGAGLPLTSTANGLVYRIAGEEGVANVLGFQRSGGGAYGADGTYNHRPHPQPGPEHRASRGCAFPTDFTATYPNFFYIHKPKAPVTKFRFADSRPPVPARQRFDFPLTRTEGGTQAASQPIHLRGAGRNTQTYSNEQISFLRDGALTTSPGPVLLKTTACSTWVMWWGDDLGPARPGLLSWRRTGESRNGCVIGNHDFDFDARINATKRFLAPSSTVRNYYAFEQGEVLFVVLDNVFYPCTEEDFARGRLNCDPERRPNYNGRLTEDQLLWL